jgi:hypothetical protein
MNERIKLLAEQVDKEFNSPYDRHKAIERFAELIVKECMKVVINGKYSATECERNTHRIAHNNARDEASSDIKKHFGVEE